MREGLTCMQANSCCPLQESSAIPDPHALEAGPAHFSSTASKSAPNRTLRLRSCLRRLRHPLWMVYQWLVDVFIRNPLTKLLLHERLPHLPNLLVPVWPSIHKCSPMTGNAMVSKNSVRSKAKPFPSFNSYLVTATFPSGFS
jgi:hypothetical protein